MTRSRRLGFALLLVACLAGCYVPSAGRRSSKILERGWDPDARGALIILTGPVSIVHATADFAVHALVPLDYDGYFWVDRREPSPQWFRRYGGPMRPLERGRDRVSRGARDVHRGDPRRKCAGVAPGAREAWQFPICVEVLPGHYELAVNYLLRRTDDVRDKKSTVHIESTEPSVVRWNAEAGGAYLLRAVAGDCEASARPRAAEPHLEEPIARHVVAHARGERLVR